MEIWKDVIGYEDVYQVSNLGQIKSKDRYTNHHAGGLRLMKGRILNCAMDKGYFKIILCKDGLKRKTAVIHRLVALAFIPNPEKKPCINHINGIKNDNRIENLEWCTISENGLHAFKLGLIKPTSGEISGRSKLTEKEVLEIRASNLSQKELAKIYKVDPSAISLIINRINWNHI